MIKDNSQLERPKKVEMSKNIGQSFSSPTADTIQNKGVINSPQKPETRQGVKETSLVESSTEDTSNSIKKELDKDYE